MSTHSTLCPTREAAEPVYREQAVMGSRTSERHVQQLKKLTVWPLLRLRVPSSKLLYCMHPETATNQWRSCQLNRPFALHERLRNPFIGSRPWWDPGQASDMSNNWKSSLCDHCCAWECLQASCCTVCTLKLQQIFHVFFFVFQMCCVLCLFVFLKL